MATEKSKIYEIKHEASLSAAHFQNSLSNFIGERRYYLTGQLRHQEKLKKFQFDRHLPSVGDLSQIDLKLQLRIPIDADFPEVLPIFEEKKKVIIDPLLDKWLPD